MKSGFLAQGVAIALGLSTMMAPQGSAETETNENESVIEATTEVSTEDIVGKEEDADETEESVEVDESEEEDEAEAIDESNADDLVPGYIYIYHHTINGIQFKLVLDLSDWQKHTKAEDLLKIKELFYEVYPQMYDRFGGYKPSPTDVEIKVRNYTNDEDNPAAYTTKNQIYLNDKFLESNPMHYDCMTHELAHVIQNGWAGEKVEYGMDSIESFANYCRFVYAYKDGRYNDMVHEMKDAEAKNVRDKSTRFLVWLDQQALSSDRDIMRDYFELCSDGSYTKDNWDKAWKRLFKGTKFEGKSIDKVWKMYLDSKFAYYSSKAADENSKSELIEKTDVRNYIKKNAFSQKYEDSLKAKKK